MSIQRVDIFLPANHYGAPPTFYATYEFLRYYLEGGQLFMVNARHSLANPNDAPTPLLVYVPPPGALLVFNVPPDTP